MQRGYIYARYSSASQKSESIEQQIAIIQDYAKRNNIEIIGTYADKAISGKHAENRPELQRMLYDCDRKQVDVVIVYRLDRFARNRYDSATLKARLKKNNIKLLSAMENLSDNPESVILESVLEGMAEYYSLELSQKVKRGRDNNALKGKCNGGRRKYGHRTDENGYFAIVPEEAAPIREAARLYLEGIYPAEIARKLNMKGWRWHNGAPFKTINVIYMLTNRANAGAYVHNGEYIDNMIPAIISLEDFEEIQKMRKETKRVITKKRKSLNSADFVLTGKIKCACCGSPLTGDSGTSRNGEIHYYYTCAGKKKSHICKMKSIRKEDLESQVFQYTKSTILKDDIISIIAERCAIILENDDTLEIEKKFAKNDLKETEKKIANIMQAIENGIYTSTIQDRLSELEHAKDDLTTRLKQLDSMQPLLTKDKIAFFLSKYQNGEIDDLRWQEDIVHMLIKEILVNVHDDKKFDLTIVYNIQPIKGLTKEKEPLLSGSDMNAMVEKVLIYPNIYLIPSHMAVIARSHATY